MIKKINDLISQQIVYELFIDIYLSEFNFILFH